MTQVTIELPDQLAEQLSTYLQTHPEETIVGLIHEALKLKLLPKDSSKLLELIGIVTDVPHGATDQTKNVVQLTPRVQP